MPKTQKGHLVNLILSMTKSEKRNFKLFANRQGDNRDKPFMNLFEFIDHSGSLVESDLLKKYPKIKKNQLSNLRSNLYKQILSSLRLLYKKQAAMMQINELIDYALILHAKGLHKASLEALEKAKKAASQIENLGQKLVALDMERMIENMYITGSAAEKATEITTESQDLVKKLDRKNELSNLSLNLYALYLKIGYVRSERDRLLLEDYFDSHFPEVKEEILTASEKIYLYQSYAWYYHMVQDFANYFRFSRKWVIVMEENLDLMEVEFIAYLKAYHNLLNALYMADKHKKFLENFESFILVADNPITHSNLNNHSTFEMIRFMHTLNKVFITADYDLGVKEILPLTKVIDSGDHPWDLHREMVFCYKLACVYFGADDYPNTLKYLNKVINQPSTDVRLDIQCFTRILSLITHYELGNQTLVSHQIKSVYRFLSKMENLQSVHKEIFNFLRKIPRIDADRVTSEFKILRSTLVRLKEDPYEKRPFLYLDIIGWLDSKIQGIRIQEVIRARMKD